MLPQCKFWLNSTLMVKIASRSAAVGFKRVSSFRLRVKKTKKKHISFPADLLQNKHFFSLHFQQLFTCHSVGKLHHCLYQGGRKCSCAPMCEGVNECTFMYIAMSACVKINEKRWIFFFSNNVRGRDGAVLVLTISFTPLFVFISCLSPFIFLDRAKCKCALWKTNDRRGETRPSVNNYRKSSAPCLR